MLAKIEAKMEAMDRKINRNMDDVDRKIDELKQQPKLENATEEPESDNSHRIPFGLLIHHPTKSEFNDLEEEETHKNTLVILGPKGCGKTTSLFLAKKKLSEKYVVKYVASDLGQGDLTDHATKCDVLLLDNAVMQEECQDCKNPLLLQHFHQGPWPVINVEYSIRHVVMGEVIIIFTLYL